MASGSNRHLLEIPFCTFDLDEEIKKMREYTEGDDSFFKNVSHTLLKPAPNGNYPIPPVWDQGPFGTCFAFAPTDSIGALYAISEAENKLPVLSKQHVVDALSKKDGVVPYSMPNDPILASGDPSVDFTPPPGQRMRIAEFRRLYRRKNPAVDVVITALLQSQPVVGSIYGCLNLGRWKGDLAQGVYMGPPIRRRQSA